MTDKAFSGGHIRRAILFLDYHTYEKYIHALEILLDKNCRCYIIFASLQNYYKNQCQCRKHFLCIPHSNCAFINTSCSHPCCSSFVRFFFSNPGLFKEPSMTGKTLIVLNFSTEAYFKRL